MSLISARLRSALVPLLVLAAAACGRDALAPDAEARRTTSGYSVFISGPTSVSSERNIQLTATAAPSGSYHYQWYEKWCNAGGAPNDCVTQFYPTFSGQDLATVTEHVYEGDKYVDYKVEIRAFEGGPLLALDTHRVVGPYTLDGGCGGSTPC